MFGEFDLWGAFQVSALAGRLGRAALRQFVRLFRREGGNVAPLMALLIVPIAGAFALVIETGDWYLAQRNLQNAADSAAIAAATTGTTNEATKCGTVKGDFCFEARAAAAKYGYVDGTGNVTVTPTYGVACPGAVAACYTATITRKLPLYLTKLVGYQGDTTIGSARAQIIKAVAVVSKGDPVNYCMMTLGTGDSFVLKGGPNADMPGCDLFSNGNLACSGHTLPSSPFGYAVGSSSCGATPVGGQTTKADPYLALDGNPPIPTGSCSNTPPQGSSGPILGTDSSTWNGTVLCGDVRLNSNVCITAANTVLTIYNGHLDLAGRALRTSSTNPSCTTPPNSSPGSLTIIFTGPATGNTGAGVTYTHTPIDSGSGGIIDIAAPNSGALSGIAIMQDSRENGSRDANDMSAFGNSPTLDIQGLIYMPNANLSYRGAINLHSDGLSCIGIIAKTVTIKGTGSLLNNFAPAGVTLQCPAAGLALPGVPGTTSRHGLALVQ